MTDKTQPHSTAAAVARTGEHPLTGGQTDPFPPEGTDEKLLQNGGGHALQESDRVKATQAAIASEGQDRLVKP